jgi:hypothetical protein
MQRLRGFMGLTSGSVRWLMSRATSHAAAAGLRLSRERRARPGHVPAPDPYSCRGSTWVLVVVRTLLGGTWGPTKGSSIPSWESRTVIKGSGCAYRGPVFLRGGPDPIMHPRVYYLSLPRGTPEPAHVAGLGRHSPRVVFIL